MTTIPLTVMEWRLEAKRLQSTIDNLEEENKTLKEAVDGLEEEIRESQDCLE